MLDMICIYMNVFFFVSSFSSLTTTWTNWEELGRRKRRRERERKKVSVNIDI